MSKSHARQSPESADSVIEHPPAPLTGFVCSR
jgi:hypothetical protein